MSIKGCILTVGNNFRGFHRPVFTFVFNLKPHFPAMKFWSRLPTALQENYMHYREMCGNAIADGIFEYVLDDILPLTQGPIQITFLARLPAQIK